MKIGPVDDLYYRIKYGKIRVTNRSPMEYRFWRNVEKNGPVHPLLGTKCWIWTGPTMDNGYGKFKMLPHRYSWVLHCGETKGLFVLHKCDNRVCVNPKHLFLGTQQDNLKDMRDKGRQVRGEQQGGSKATEEVCAIIRRRYKRYSHTDGSGALAKEFNLSVVEVWRIATGKRWKHSYGSS